MLSKHWDKRSRLSWLTLLSLWLIFCKTLFLYALSLNDVLLGWLQSCCFFYPIHSSWVTLSASLSLLLILPLRFAEPPFSQLKPSLQPLMPIGHLCSDAPPISQTTPPTLLPLPGRGSNTYPLSKPSSCKPTFYRQENWGSERQRRSFGPRPASRG